MRVVRTLSKRARLVAVAAVTVLAAVADIAPAKLSGAQLAQVADVVGTAWYADPAGGKVVVTADATASAAEIAEIKAAAGDRASGLQINRTPGTFSKFIAGGDAICSGGRRSLGFNVRSGNTYCALTAGHCTAIGSTWYTNSGQSTTLGTRTGASFPGTTALGLTSGGSGNCTVGGTTFFQPVTEALNAYGVSVF
ncbi:alpha-lytic protease prodomain-containing protein [Streptomyces niveiscabiei]|uniref:alpha-lytic protease prodomain-containing protein n=1 Tax=Streptomyces niveiscabiei TaxID=164115 RepID=UPI0029B6F51B|nr:alpha-lytic protease prodomain-containing protein [Streptomyces niveiscabiei]MDX3381884.1 alpha-lytic protease prodomain-containing protein [Streptomyces niveiscabiei]